MKQIVFLDSQGGVWDSNLNIKLGINFRLLMQKAISIEKAIGDKIKIHLVNGTHWEDITDWVHKKALNLK